MIKTWDLKLNHDSYTSLVITSSKQILNRDSNFYRYDWLTNKTLRTGYFVWAMTAYGAGLLVTYVALNLMDGHGQPALLYIVPFTLGTFLTLGQMRGDLKVLWTRGEPERPCPHVRLQSSHSQ
ncbi:signal peptide peptidase-like 2 [Rosa sericea]